jgi:hypothetical protein
VLLPVASRLSSRATLAAAEKTVLSCLLIDKALDKSEVDLPPLLFAWE